MLGNFVAGTAVAQSEVRRAVPASKRDAGPTTDARRPAGRYRRSVARGARRPASGHGAQRLSLSVSLALSRREPEPGHDGDGANGTGGGRGGMGRPDSRSHSRTRSVPLRCHACRPVASPPPVTRLRGNGRVGPRHATGWQGRAIGGALYVVCAE